MAKHVVITGASAGIGRELSFIFAGHGFVPILIARNRPRLEALQKEILARTGQDSLVLPFDLSKSGAPQNIYDAVREQAAGPVFALVNNAGFGLHGRFAQTDLHEELNMIDLNIRSLTHLTKLFLPGMIDAAQGKILNVASVASFLPGPMMAVYYATKAYVLSFSEALHTELKPYKITVTALCPGPTKTEFAKRAKLDNSRMFNGHLMPVKDAHTVAMAGYRGLMKGKAIVVPGILNKLTIQVLRFTPRNLVRTLAYVIMQKR
ncbi:short-chain dehydrogenase [candidate division KSB1 bacterium]|nr:MAG: short-chain dehydrogenase [candidate division KSB1 bacterium]